MPIFLKFSKIPHSKRFKTFSMIVYDSLSMPRETSDNQYTMLKTVHTSTYKVNFCKLRRIALIYLFN